jgi:hypothetical protein
MWSEIIITGTSENGETQQLLSGAGASNRRYITQKLRNHLGLLNAEPEQAKAA